MTYPKTIFLIRHAEKTADDTDPHISLKGSRRATALVGLFGPGGRLSGPTVLIAADRSKHSNRSVETLVPLSLRLGLPISHEYEDDEYRDLARRLKTGKKYQGSVVLIAWHHENIPNLAKALGVKAGDLPWKHWPNAVYDVVWTLGFDAAGLAWLRSEPQGLEL